MTVLKTHALTGTAGGTVTTASEGFNAVSSTLTYTTLSGATGGTGVLVATGVTAYGEDSSTTNSHIAFYVQLPTLPTGDCSILSTLATSTTVSLIGILATGAVRIYSSSGTTIATTTATLSTGTWYRIEYSAIATGQELRLYAAAGSTAIETISGAINGSTAPNKWRIGHPQSTKTAGDIYFDQYTLHDTWPNLGNMPPVAAFIYSSSALVLSVDGTGSTDPDGTIASYDWDWGDATTHGTGSTTTHTYASSGTYTVNLTVTDNLGGTNSVSHSVSVSTGGASVVEFHPHDGTVGATPTTGAEGYNVISGTQVYVAGGISGSPVCSIRYATGDIAYAQDSSTTNTYVGFWVRAPSLPTGDVVIATTLNGATTVAGVGLLSTGAVRIYSSSGTTIATTTATLTANVWYRIEWNVEVTGQILRLYPAASGTLTEQISGAVQTTGGPLDTWRFGHPQSTKVAGTIDLDRVTQVSGGWPALVNTTPVAAYTHSETGLALSVNAATTTDDFGIATYDWDWGDATGHGSGVTSSHTYAAGGTYTVVLTATDGFGASNTSSQSVTVTSSTSSVVKVHPHDGTAGGNPTAGPENYNSIFGTMTYVTGGVTNNSALRTASGATAYGEDSATSNLFVAIYVRVVTLPTGDMTFASALFGASGIAYLGLLSTGAVRIYSTAGTTANTTTATLTANTWYRIEWNVSASGQEVRLYTASGSSLIESKTGVVAAASDPNKWRFGHPNSGKIAGDVDLDQITLVSGGWPDQSNNAPVASFTKSISGLTVNVDATASTDDIGIASYDWNWGDSSTHGTGVTSTHAYAAAGTYSLVLTVTDTLGLTNTATQSTVVGNPTFAIRIQPGDTSTLAAVRGVIVSGTEVPARLREVVGNNTAPESGTPLPRTIPFTIGT